MVYETSRCNGNNHSTLYNRKVAPFDIWNYLHLLPLIVLSLPSFLYNRSLGIDIKNGLKMEPESSWSLVTSQTSWLIAQIVN